MRNNRKRSARKIVLVVLIILILLGMSYVFAFKPLFNNYVSNKQLEAQRLILSVLVNQVRTNGYVEIPVDEDKMLVLVPYQAPQETNQ